MFAGIPCWDGTTPDVVRAFAGRRGRDQHAQLVRDALDRPLSGLRKAIRRREIWVEGANTWRNPTRICPGPGRRVRRGGAQLPQPRQGAGGKYRAVIPAVGSRIPACRPAAHQRDRQEASGQVISICLPALITLVGEGDDIGVDLGFERLGEHLHRTSA
ncbi:hypothetical protein ABZ897_27435 [Nonomuraea sp. NPDC046802]|uniref:hypothetical protein n=1 Tax=Nonomuraea sp. NPDC046802 TaxID=3154919 RepID=UPI0033C01AFA